MSERSYSVEIIMDESSKDWVSNYLLNRANPAWLKTLSPQQIRYLTLRFEKRMSNAKIAEVLGSTKNRRTHKRRDESLTRAGTRFIRESILETLKPFVHPEDLETFHFKWHRATIDNLTISKEQAQRLNFNITAQSIR